MKVEFYNTTPEYEEFENCAYYYYAFSVFPSLTITNSDITLHWLFWGVELKYK